MSSSSWIFTKFNLKMHNNFFFQIIGYCFQTSSSTCTKKNTFHICLLIVFLTEILFPQRTITKKKTSKYVQVFVTLTILVSSSQVKCWNVALMKAPSHSIFPELLSRFLFLRNIILNHREKYYTWNFQIFMLVEDK